MRDASVEEPHLFVADLYLGNDIEETVYLDRRALLQWIHPIAPQAESSAARAMELLMSHPEQAICTIPLSPMIDALLPTQVLQ